MVFEHGTDFKLVLGICLKPDGSNHSITISPQLKCSLTNYPEEIEIEINPPDNLLKNYKISNKDNDSLMKFILKHQEKGEENKLLRNYRNSDTVRVLLKNGENPLGQNKNKDTILHLMCSQENKVYDRNLIKQICEKTPEIKCMENKDGFTPYELAKDSKKYDLLYITGTADFDNCLVNLFIIQLQFHV